MLSWKPQRELRSVNLRLSQRFQNAEDVMSEQFAGPQLQNPNSKQKYDLRLRVISKIQNEQHVPFRKHLAVPVLARPQG